MKVLALRWGTVALLILLWEFAVRLFVSDSSFFAAPSTIFIHGPSVFADPFVQKGLTATAVRFAAAFLISASAGILIGLTLGRLVRIAPIARNVAIVLYAVPQVAFFPIFVLWFGLGQNSEIAFGVSHGLIPVMLGTITAAGLVDAELLESARAMGANRVQRLVRVILPACVPAIVSALRVGASLTLLGVLLAELLVSTDGVGGVVAVLSGTVQPARLNALILGISVAALLMNVLIGRIESFTVRQRAPGNAPH